MQHVQYGKMGGLVGNEHHFTDKEINAKRHRSKYVGIVEIHMLYGNSQDSMENTILNFDMLFILRAIYNNLCYHFAMKMHL